MEQYQKVVDLWRSFSVESPADLDKYLDSFRILREYDEAEEISPLLNFLRRQCEKTWAKTLELSGGSAPERKGLSDFVSG